MSTKKYVSDNTSLMAEWDFIKNEAYGLDPNKLTLGSAKKVYWVCAKGHSWSASIEKRNNGSSCPHCSGRLVNDNNRFSKYYPDIAKEWDYSKNKDLSPEEVTYGSAIKVFWICPQGHSYKASIHNRTNANSNCPYCSGHKLLKGFNDFATKYPELLKYWDYEKNNITPDSFLANKSKKVWWKCSNSHSFQSTISSKLRAPNSCPICSGRIVQEGVNDLFTANPTVRKYWDYEKNTLNPLQVTMHSNKEAWWICDKGHSFKRSIAKVSSGKFCPYCAKHNSSVLSGENDLATKHPQLLSEWDYTKNEKQPSEYNQKSGKKVFWICPNGHSYQCTIANRVNGTGCPICAKRNRTSFPEQAIFYYLNLKYKAINSYTEIFQNGMELDIFIPEINTAIEYDGKQWHNNKKSKTIAYKKYDVCREHNIKLVRIKENTIDLELKDCDFSILSEYNHNNYDKLDNCIRELLIYLNIKDIDINTSRDRNIIKSIYYDNIYVKSLEYRFPMIAKEWDYEKNYPITPAMVFARTSEKYYFKCNSGHESYLASPANRTKPQGGTGCPKCKSKKPTKRQRPINQYDSNHNLIQTYESLNEASIKTGIDKRKISAVALQKDGRKSTHGYIWRYASDKLDNSTPPKRKH